MQYDLYDFFELFNSLFCNRCKINHTQSKNKETANIFIKYLEEIKEDYKNEHPVYLGMFGGEKNKIFNISSEGSVERNVHSYNYISKYMYSKKLNQKYINNWYQDIEHGYFHSIMVCFIAYFFSKYVYKNLFIEEKKFLRSKKRNPEDTEYKNYLKNINKIFLSCLLHDFIKCTDGHKNHDVNLRNFFPNLLEETYRHSNPLESDKDNILITSDRIELRRYNDYNEWKDNNIHNYYQNKLNTFQKTYLDIFYKNVRPCLEYFFANKNSHFIRHGLEIDYKYIKKNKYPQYSYSAEAINMENNKKFTNNYAIEIDKYPFNHCSKHSANNIWTYVQGMKKMNGKLINDSIFGFWLDCYDHPCIKTKDYRFSEWKFTLRPEIFLKNKNLEYDLDYLFNKVYSPYYINLIENNLIQSSDIPDLFKYKPKTCGRLEGEKIYKNLMNKKNEYPSIFDNILPVLLKYNTVFTVNEINNLMDINLFNSQKYLKLFSCIK